MSGCPAVFFRAIGTFLPRSYRLSKELREDLWECFQQREVRHFVVRLCAGYQGTLPKLQRSYPAIKTPSLFLWAGRDKHFPVSDGRQLGALVPKAQVEAIPEAEHWMALREFLALSGLPMPGELMIFPAEAPTDPSQLSLQRLQLNAAGIAELSQRIFTVHRAKLDLVRGQVRLRISGQDHSYNFLGTIQDARRRT